METYAKRRTTPRYLMVAAVTMTDVSAAMQVSGRVTEISRKGCFIDALNTLPQGTTVNVLISRDQGAFATKGKILYVQENIGMGVGFDETPADQIKLLDTWLADL